MDRSITGSPRYIEGKDNVLADLMSRPQEITKAPLIELIQELQVGEVSASIVNVREVAEFQTPEFIASCAIPVEFLEVINGAYFNTTWGRPCLVLPPIFRTQVLETIHNTTHYGNKRTFRTIAQHYWWLKNG